MGKISLSVVIPFFRGNRSPKSILPILESCEMQKGLSGEFEIILVNNVKDLEVEQLVKRFKYLKTLTVGNVGVNRARNLGAKNSAGNYILFLDDDCVLPNVDFLETLANMMKKDPSLKVLGGGYFSDKRDNWKIRYYNKMANEWIKVGLQPDTNSIDYCPASNLLGGNVCYKSEIFDQGFFFDESIISGGDETEFHHRLKESGFTLGYSSKLDVLHQASGTWRSLITRAWNQGSNSYRYHRAQRTSLTSKLRAVKSISKNDPQLLAFLSVHYPIFLVASIFSVSKKYQQSP